MITQKLNVWSLLKKSFLATACIACSAEVMAENEPEIVNGIKYSITDAKSVKVVGYEETLPSELTLDSVQIEGNWYKVTSIGYEAFKYCSQLKSIASTSVTFIDKWSFQYCENLTSVSLPNVTKMGDASFDYCSGLQSISLPSATEIGSWQFSHCKNITSISLGPVTSMLDYTFNDCPKLTTLSLRQSDVSKLTIDPGVFKGEFSNIDPRNITLIVPTGSRNNYLAVQNEMGVSFKEVIEKEFLDLGATYVVITEKDGKQTTVKVDADVKVEWMKGSEIK